MLKRIFGDWMRGASHDSAVAPVGRPSVARFENEGLTLLSTDESDSTSPGLIQDVVFIRDLAQSSAETWTRQESFWPESLSSKFRVFSFEYNSGSLGNLGDIVSCDRIVAHAKALLADLEGRRLEHDFGFTPILVAHGYGGLICEQAYLLDLEEYKEAKVHFGGLVLFGTPHFRAGLAQWALMSAKKLQIQCADTPRLQDWSMVRDDLIRIAALQKRFRDIEPQPKMVCYFAMLAVPQSNLRMSPEWALLPGVKSVALSSDHYEMTKFESIGRKNFEELAKLLGGKLSVRVSQETLKRLWRNTAKGHEEVGVTKTGFERKPVSAIIDIEQSSEASSQSAAGPSISWRKQDDFFLEQFHDVDLPEFRYEPLSGDLTRTTRLVKLHAFDASEMSVSCELLEVKIEDMPSTDFEAISWSWGNWIPTYSLTIIRDGKRYKKRVSKELIQMLGELRHPSRDRVIWIDALCADGTNYEEWGNLTSILARVFSLARTVCIWLGMADEHSRGAIRFFQETNLDLQILDQSQNHHESQLFRYHDDLMAFLGRDWFARRWNIQELALAKDAIIYCGSESLTWVEFALAFEYLSDIERKPSSSLSRWETRLKRGQISHSGVRLLIQVKDSIANAAKRQGEDALYPSESYKPQESILSRYKTPVLRWERLDDPLFSPLTKTQFSLEYLVTAAVHFKVSNPLDAIYSLISLARDAVPLSRVESQGRIGQELIMLEPILPAKAFLVDYTRPYTDVCRDFVEFSIRRRAEIEPSQALDILCRPWAPDPLSSITREYPVPLLTEFSDSYLESRDLKLGNIPGWSSGARGEMYKKFLYPKSENLPLPSWVSMASKAPYKTFKPSSEYDYSTNRANADPLVGAARDGRSDYCAAKTQGVDLSTLKFKKRPVLGHYSMYIRGFQLDTVEEVSETSRRGNIPKSWLNLAGWVDFEDDPPDSFWRTIVAYNGQIDRRSSRHFARMCRSARLQSGMRAGSIDISALLDHDVHIDALLREFCLCVQAVTWNRRLFKTETGMLGLAGDVVQGDVVGILYGCSVPIILRPNSKSPGDIQREEMQDQAEALRSCIRKLEIRKHMRKQLQRGRTEDTGDDVQKRRGGTAKTRPAIERSLREDNTSAQGQKYTGSEAQAGSLRFFEFRGECYVDGMMDGEAMHDKFDREIADEIFELR